MDAVAHARVGRPRSGPRRRLLAEKILASKTFPEQGYRAVLGILRLGRDYGHERLEAACGRAVRFGTCSYRSVYAILARGLDKDAAEQDAAGQTALPFHENIRGGEYYH